MGIFSKRTRELWNEWEVRVMVLISLSLQITLIVLGKWLKYSARHWVGIVLWLTYLSADLVATVALGVLCNKEGDSESIDTSAANPDSVIMAFWAPFLLLHLGGPDTITAYSIEDNELWKRHLLGLIVQVGVASYVILRSWMGSGSPFMLLAISIFIAGVTKYGERTWVLWSASHRRFRDSLLPPPSNSTTSAHHNYVKIDEKHQVERVTPREPFQMFTIDTDIIPNAKILHEAYQFFKIFRRLYADLPFNFKQISDSCTIFLKKSPEEAFEIVELELGFLYDVLYTKAPLVYSLAGSCIRSISFIFTVSAFIGFLVIDKRAYSPVNVIISYVLLVGAIILDISTAISLLFSDWTKLWLSKPMKPRLNRIYPAISCLQLAISENRRWSHSMAQYNLIDHCLRHESADCLGIYELLESCRQVDLVDVSIDLKQFIIQHLQALAEGFEGLSYAERINMVGLLSNFGGSLGGELGDIEQIAWSLDADFDTRIIIWHIGTDLFYDFERHNKSQQDDAALSIRSKISKWLSDYMIYLVVKRPFMLPKGIGQIRYQDTIAEAARLFKLRGLSRCAAIQMLHQEPGKLLLEEATSRFEVSTDNQDPNNTIVAKGESSRTELSTPTNAPKDDQDLDALSEGDSSKSVLLEGCRLAKSLQSLKTEDEELQDFDIWDLISTVWVDMLCYAAQQCSWNQHAQQLGQGGELLTLVSLFMAHYGFTEQLKPKLGRPPHLGNILLVDEK